MTTLVVFALEGVLQSDSGRPVESGCRLYRTMRNALASQVLVLAEAKDIPARRFFDQQHMPAPALVVPELSTTPLDWTYECVKIRRAYPYDIDWIVTPDPDIAAALYYEGFRTLLWIDPRYSRPEWRPDAPPHAASSWTRLADGLREDRELIRTDERLSRE